MTLIYKIGLDILKTYLHTKNEAFRSTLSKARAQTRHTETHTHRQTNTTELLPAVLAGGNTERPRKTDQKSVPEQIRRKCS